MYTFLFFSDIFVLEKKLKKTEIAVQVFNSLEEIESILKNQGYEMTQTYSINDWYFSKLENISNVKYLDLLNNSFIVRQVLTD